ncbi:MAG TPA: hypothetical protein VIM40_04255, partial [Arthrobacter sp.]
MDRNWNELLQELRVLHVALLIAGCAGLVFSAVRGQETGTIAGLSILVALAALAPPHPLFSL